MIAMCRSHKRTWSIASKSAASPRKLKLVVSRGPKNCSGPNERPEMQTMQTVLDQKKFDRSDVGSNNHECFGMKTKIAILLLVGLVTTGLPALAQNENAQAAKPVQAAQQPKPGDLDARPAEGGDDVIESIKYGEDT